MCEFGDKFKLCTCYDGIDHSKPHRVLERMNSNLKDMEMVHIGMFPPEYHFKIEFILTEMNKNNPFDLNLTIADVEAKFFEAYPTYDFLIYEPLLDSSSAFEKAQMFPLSVFWHDETFFDELKFRWNFFPSYTI